LHQQFTLFCPWRIINLGFAYPDSEVERSQRGGAGDPEPVGFVGLDGEDHRGAMFVAAGGALLGAWRVRRRERAVELPPTVDQQRLQQNKKTRCMSLTQKIPAEPPIMVARRKHLPM
jgi:hypothetical protein